MLAASRAAKADEAGDCKAVSSILRSLKGFRPRSLPMLCDGSGVPYADAELQAAVLQRHFAGLMNGRIVQPHESIPSAGYLPASTKLRVPSAQELAGMFAQAKAGRAHGLR